MWLLRFWLYIDFFVGVFSVGGLRGFGCLIIWWVFSFFRLKF